MKNFLHLQQHRSITSIHLSSSVLNHAPLLCRTRLLYLNYITRPMRNLCIVASRSINYAFELSTKRSFLSNSLMEYVIFLGKNQVLSQRIFSGCKYVWKSKIASIAWDGILIRGKIHFKIWRLCLERFPFCLTSRYSEKGVTEKGVMHSYNPIVSLLRVLYLLTGSSRLARLRVLRLYIPF